MVRAGPLSNLLEDIFKLPFFKDLMLAHKLIKRKVTTEVPNSRESCHDRGT
jgi:hypothetical protein